MGKNDKDILNQFVNNSRKSKKINTENKKPTFNEKTACGLLDSNPIPTLILNKNHRLIYWNKALEKLSGIKAHKVIGTKKQWRAFYNEQRPIMADLILKKANKNIIKNYYKAEHIKQISEDTYEAVTYFNHLGKKGKWLYLTACPIKNDEGHLIGAIETLQNFTGYKNMEIKLKEEENKYRNLIENQPVGIITCDRKGNINYINSQSIKILGSPDKQETERINLLKFPLLKKIRFSNHLKKCLETGKPITSEKKYKSKWGKLIWIRYHIHPLKENENIKGAQIIIDDISKTKKTKEELIEKEKRLQLALDGGNLGTWDWNIKTDEVIFDKRWAEIKGYNLNEIEPNLTTWENLVHPDDLSEVYDILNAHLRGETESYESKYRVKHKSGKWLWILDKGKVVKRDKEGNPLRACGTHLNITQQKKMENKLEHFNQVLLSIRNVNQLIIRVQDKNQLIKEACNQLIKNRGYNAAWIILFDKDKSYLTSAEAGVGKDFITLINQFKKGNLNVCTKKALAQPGIVRIDEFEGECNTCPLYKNEINNDAKYLSARLDCKNNTYGIISVLIPKNFAYLEKELELFQEVTGDIAFGIHDIEIENERNKTYRKLKQSHIKLNHAFHGTIKALANTLAQRDPYTAGHQRKVTQLALAIAEELGLSEKKGLEVAATIHDIGKINIPTEILSKPTKLSHLEMELVKSHAQAGYEILKEIGLPWPVDKIVYQHHERIDGSGYPQGLTEEEIIEEAKILAVADVVEAMCSHRPYRPALGIDKALKEIKRNKGLLYESKVVEACLEVFEDGFKFQEN